MPGGLGRVLGVDGEVGGQLHDVLVPGGVAERQVHGPLEGSRCATAACASAIAEVSNRGHYLGKQVLDCC